MSEDDIIASPDIFEFIDYGYNLMAVDPKIRILTTHALDRRYPWDTIRYPNLDQAISNNISLSQSEIAHQIFLKPSTDIVFKPFVWGLHRSAVQYLIDALQSNLDYRPTLETPIDPYFSGCWYCENYCLDHVIEWAFKDELVVYPHLPRATQNSHGGMTEFSDSYTRNPFYQEAHGLDFFVSYLPVF